MTDDALPSGAQRWSQSSPGVPGTNEAGDEFGAWLAAADVGGSGAEELVIGSAAEDLEVGGRSLHDAGRAFVLLGGGGGLSSTRLTVWTQSAGGTPERYDWFGSAISAP